MTLRQWFNHWPIDQWTVGYFDGWRGASENLPDQNLVEYLVGYDEGYMERRDTQTRGGITNSRPEQGFSL